jgi:hypothetical protein
MNDQRNKNYFEFDNHTALNNVQSPCSENSLPSVIPVLLRIYAVFKVRVCTLRSWTALL